jgi:hypothetical protein
MRKLFKERKLFKGGNYMRKYGIRNGTSSSQNAPLCKEEDKNNNNPIYSLDMQ